MAKGFWYNNNVEDISVRDIAEDSDGSIILTGFDMEATPLGNFRILYAKFDSQGNIQLSKFFVPPFAAYGASMMVNSVTIKEGYTYIAGNIPITFLKGLIMKINNNTGALEWAKTYDFNKGEADFSQLLQYSNDQLCAIGANKLNPEDTSIIFILNRDGQPSSVKYYQYPTILTSEHTIYGDAMFDKDYNLIWAMKQKSSVKETLTISKVNPVSGVIWANDYIQIAENPRTSSIQFGSDSSIYTAGSNGGPGGWSQFFIAKLGANGEANCEPLVLKTSFGNGKTLVTDITFSVANKSIIPKTGVTNIVANHLVFFDSLCTTVNPCRTIKLSALDTICNIKDTIRVKIEKSVGCTLDPNFIYDSTRLKLVSLSDSIAKFLGLRSGVVKLTAFLPSSCKILEDSIKVVLSLDIASFTLGRDTILCPNAVILLKAPKGFASYVWQDGSVDSLFTATTPGTYHVTLNDHCHNMSSDTVVVLPSTRPSFNWHPSYLKCSNDTISLALPTGLTGYAFQPASELGIIGNHLQVWTSKSTDYLIKAISTEGCTISDILAVRVNPNTPIVLQNDTTICEGSTVTFKAPNRFQSYLWNTGSTIKDIVISAPGKYWVSVVDINQCKFSDTLNLFVNNKPVLSLGNDTTICPDKILDIRAPGTFKSYLWQDGTTKNNFITKTPGSYWVTVTDFNGCGNADTLKVLGYKQVPANFLSKLDSVCIYEPKTIYAVGRWSSYSWNTGSTTSSIIVDKPGVYSVTVSNQDYCFATDTIKIINQDCSGGIHFPSAFSPNGDGKNDVFKPVVHMRLAQYYFAVYNRFGQKLFDTNDPKRGWDGTLGSKPQDPGTFAWFCQYGINNVNLINERGAMILVR